jgi:hypothetical protein
LNPLSMRIMIFPLECFADTGLSIKVFMPLVYSKLLMLDCKIFCLCKFAGLHSDRLTQDDLALHEKTASPSPRFTCTWIGVWSLL